MLKCATVERETLANAMGKKKGGRPPTREDPDFNKVRSREYIDIR